MAAILRKEHVGTAARTTLSADITAGALTFSAPSGGGTGYPTGAGGNFIITIDRDVAGKEEKVLCSSRAGDVFTVVALGRGLDGSTGVTHTTGATVEHTTAAYEVDELNAHGADVTRDDHTQYHDSTRHAAVLHTAAMLDNLAVTTAKIDSLAVTASKIAADAVTTVKILDANVTAGKLASDSVTTVKVLDSNITTDKLADAGVTTAKLAANIPLGRLGEAKVTTGQTTSGASSTDLTGLSVTVNVGTSRNLKISAIVPVYSTNTGVCVNIQIKHSSGTILEEIFTRCETSGNVATATGFGTATATGSHTYILSIVRHAGTGNIHTSPSATRPATLLVEDMGG